jgi:hypothetical protein
MAFTVCVPFVWEERTSSRRLASAAAAVRFEEVEVFIVLSDTVVWIQGHDYSPAAPFALQVHPR